MTHLEEMVVLQDREAERILRSQVVGGRENGAFAEADGNIDTRRNGFMLAHLAVSYLTPQSRFFHDPRVRTVLEGSFAYLLSHQRPGGCLDLTGCNFASAPDTAFTINAVMNAWWLLEKDGSEDCAWMKAPMRRLIETCSEGIMTGGFHTPNHRWAISACLKHAAKICGRPDFSAKADVYLGEGLDINEDGEFAERSAGNYNQVNDDQMIRLYLAMGDETFLQAARSNLMMMLAYIDPDGSVFTNNSTRQDYGKKVYLDSYYILFLLTGYLLKDEKLAAYSEYCWQTAAAHGRTPRGAEWLALYPELEAWGKRVAPDLAPIENYRHIFPSSSIARFRAGDLSCTLMAGRPNFFYFQHGENTIYLVIYGNVCEKRNFVPTSLEETEKGFRVSARMDSWYYLPFDGDGPATTDWWAMDNANTREKLISDSLTITVEAELKENGVDLRVAAQGLTHVPIRLEWGMMPGCELRGDSFLLDTVPGGSMTVSGGALQIRNPADEMVTLAPAFAEHRVMNRMGGAYPLSGEHFTAFFTAYSPFEKVIRIGTAPLFDRLMYGGLSDRPPTPPSGDKD